jgi:hypothetical protein
LKIRPEKRIGFMHVDIPTPDSDMKPVYSNYGTAKSPGLGLLPFSILFRQTSICTSAIVGSQYGATAGAAESLRAPFYSQDAHYAETRKSKNSTQKRNFKSKRTRSSCVQTSDLSFDTKNIIKSCETIPLMVAYRKAPRQTMVGF